MPADGHGGSAYCVLLAAGLSNAGDCCRFDESDRRRLLQLFGRGDDRPMDLNVFVRDAKMVDIFCGHAADESGSPSQANPVMTCSGLPIAQSLPSVRPQRPLELPPSRSTLWACLQGPLNTYAQRAVDTGVGPTAIWGVVEGREVLLTLTARSATLFEQWGGSPRAVVIVRPQIDKLLSPQALPITAILATYEPPRDLAACSMATRASTNADER